MTLKPWPDFTELKYASLVGISSGRTGSVSLANGTTQVSQELSKPVEVCVGTFTFSLIFSTGRICLLYCPGFRLVAVFLCNFDWDTMSVQIHHQGITSPVDLQRLPTTAAPGPGLSLCLIKWSLKLQKNPALIYKFFLTYFERRLAQISPGDAQTTFVLTPSRQGHVG